MSKKSFIWYKTIRRAGFIILGLVFLILLYMYNTNRYNKSPAPQVSNNYIRSYSESSIVDSNKTEIKQKRNIEKKINDSSIVNLDSLRRSIMKQCLKATEDIARQSSVDEAIQVAEFLKKNLTLARPDGGAISSIDSVSKPFLGFVVAFQQDDLPPVGWYKAALSNSGVNYVPLPNNVLLAKQEDLGSDLIKGLMFIYQGSQTRVAETSNFRNVNFYLSEDVKSHEIINQMLSSLGGDDYLNLLNLEIGRLQARMDSSAYPIWPRRISYPKELHEMFSARSFVEIDYIEKMFWVHAMFSIIENRHALSTESKMKQKIDFMDLIHYHKN